MRVATYRKGGEIDMAHVMVISDPKSGKSTGDWVVKVGNRQISRHRTKSAAKSKARKEAKKRGAQLRVQNTQGQWSQGPSY